VHRRGVAGRGQGRRDDRRRGQRHAPALRSADIGVAMGRSGTDVAREASMIPLTDDNFATIVAAVEGGRRAHDNVRKFILYIFAHASQRSLPALSGGKIPVPLTVLQPPAFDVGTETLALALGREPAKPGLMHRPPRPTLGGCDPPADKAAGVAVTRPHSAYMQVAGYFFVLLRGGWHLGAPVHRRSPLHHAYVTATPMTFFGMIARQIGTAFGADRARAAAVAGRVLQSIPAMGNRIRARAGRGPDLRAAVSRNACNRPARPGRTAVRVAAPVHRVAPTSCGAT